MGYRVSNTPICLPIQIKDGDIVQYFKGIEIARVKARLPKKLNSTIQCNNVSFFDSDFKGIVSVNEKYLVLFRGGDMIEVVDKQKDYQLLSRVKRNLSDLEYKVKEYFKCGVLKTDGGDRNLYCVILEDKRAILFTKTDGYSFHLDLNKLSKDEIIELYKVIENEYLVRLLRTDYNSNNKNLTFEILDIFNKFISGVERYGRESRFVDIR